MEDALEEETEPHSSILAQRVPWTEEPSRLWFMELLRVRHDGASEHTYKLSTKQPMANHFWEEKLLQLLGGETPALKTLYNICYYLKNVFSSYKTASLLLQVLSYLWE